VIGPNFQIRTARGALRAPNSPYTGNWVWLVAARARRLFAIAVATVDGPVAPGLEGHLSLRAALCASDRVHLPRGTSITASTPATSPPSIAAGAPAVWAALWQVGVPFLRMELLFLDSEGEGLSTVLARKGLFLEAHQ